MALSAEESAARLARLQERLQPWRIRAMLGFAGLYLIIYELLKATALGRLREHYGWVDLGDQEVFVHTEEERNRYNVEVRGLDKNPFRAALIWLVRAGVITQEEADRLEPIYQLRHDMAHKLLGRIVDPDFLPDAGLLKDALQILIKIEQHWIQYKIDTGAFVPLDGGGDFDFSEMTIDDVQPGWASVVWLCLDAYMEGVDRDVRDVAASAATKDADPPTAPQPEAHEPET
jgi:hypothetical protein